MSDHETPNSIVEGRIGYQFEDQTLLTTALTHSSYAAEHDVASYERLEFLGDAVLGMAVTIEIYAALSDAPEGRMTRVRATVVDGATLASVSRNIGLPEAVRLGIGEERGGGRDRPSTQADIVESVIGAVYVDGGVDAAFAVVAGLMGDAISTSFESLDSVDSRSALQERLGSDGKVVSFEFEKSGPEHEPQFVATAFVDGVELGGGSGSSKKAAAIDAARAILASMDS